MILTLRGQYPTTGKASWHPLPPFFDVLFHYLLVFVGLGTFCFHLLLACGEVACLADLLQQPLCHLLHPIGGPSRNSDNAHKRGGRNPYWLILA